MDCRAFRELHGDWVDDVLDPSESDRLDGHLAACAPCARFDTLARRALMVARNAPQIEVSSDFSARLAARIAEERRRRIAEIAPSRVERRVLLSAGQVVWVWRAAAVAAMIGGSMIVRSAMSGATTTTNSFAGTDTAAINAIGGMSIVPASSASGMSAGEIVVVRSMRPIGGALLPLSDDPLLDGVDKAGHGEGNATTVAATAPLWPTAQMAAHAANRFAAMEFGDVVPVSVMHTPR